MNLEKKLVDTFLANDVTFLLSQEWSSSIYATPLMIHFIHELAVVEKKRVLVVSTPNEFDEDAVSYSASLVSVMTKIPVTDVLAHLDPFHYYLTERYEAHPITQKDAFVDALNVIRESKLDIRSPYRSLEFIDKNRKEYDVVILKDFKESVLKGMKDASEEALPKVLHKIENYAQKNHVKFLLMEGGLEGIHLLKYFKNIPTYMIHESTMNGILVNSFDNGNELIMDSQTYELKDFRSDDESIYEVFRKMSEDSNFLLLVCKDEAEKEKMMSFVNRYYIDEPYYTVSSLENFDMDFLKDRKERYIVVEHLDDVFRSDAKQGKKFLNEIYSFAKYEEKHVIFLDLIGDKVNPTFLSEYEAFSHNYCVMERYDNDTNGVVFFFRSTPESSSKRNFIIP